MTKRPLTDTERRVLDEHRRKLLDKQQRYRDGLPFLYGHKWYAWQRDFFKSRNPMRLMSCGNQVGKSSIHIWDKVNRATDLKLHEELWPGRRPDLFWFWYTDQDTLDREFALKWKRWLPQGDFKDSAQYGWKLIADRKERNVEAVKFNSGILLEFKLYTQNPRNVQSATVFDMGCDEEPPIVFWDEAYQRLSSTGRYFSAAFTATLNQMMWWRALEGQGEAEMFPDAFKMQVSKYDCMHFDDGTPGLYTEEQIQAEIKACSSEAQVNRRIYGKFSAESGRKFHTFDPSRHYVTPREIPQDWFRYSGVDIGSGNSGRPKPGSRANHPAAFYFVAVRPDFRLGYVYKGRRLDNEQTTAGDVYNAYVVERGSDVMTTEKYDYHSKDFRIITDRNGESFIEADKSHERGEEVINTLFANDMLFLFDTPEVRKVGEEMLTLMKTTDKRVAIDDAADGCRYAVVDIPWDWTLIQGKPPDGTGKARPEQTFKTAEQYAEDERQRAFSGGGGSAHDDWAEEIDYWNDLYGG